MGMVYFEEKNLNLWGSYHMMVATLLLYPLMDIYVSQPVRQTLQAQKEIGKCKLSLLQFITI